MKDAKNSPKKDLKKYYFQCMKVKKKHYI